MQQKFMIKERDKHTFYISLIGLSFSITLSLMAKSYVGIPIILIFFISILSDSIMSFRWFTSFAVCLDMDKQEIILNHNWAFREKKIPLKDVKEVDTLNGNIILFGSTPLSKWQRIICKTKKSDDYTVRFYSIEICEKRRLIELLYTLKSKE
jgi:hypothetical protein